MRFLAKILVPSGSKDIPVSTPIAILIIARRLLESKTQTPHVFVEAEALIDATLALRKDLKGYWDAAKEEIVEQTSIDISVAVATDKGLMTPIVKNADRKSLTAISRESGILAVGRGTQVARWQEEESNGPEAGAGGGPVAVTKMALTLSGDARVMDEEVAAKFLEILASNLAIPHRLLL
eukprot:jgi/Mesen1/6273/ME000324S05313